MGRISRIELGLGMAELFAKRSTCGRLNVGCVITRNGRIVASGYNGPLKSTFPGLPNEFKTCMCNTDKPCTKSIHAEANAIAFSARNGIALEGTTMYCTHSPCVKCAELIIQAGIDAVVFKEVFRDDLGIQLLTANKVNTMLYVD